MRAGILSFGASASSNLRESSLEAAFNALPLGTAVLDSKGRLLFANAAFRTLLGDSAVDEAAFADLIAPGADERSSVARHGRLLTVTNRPLANQCRLLSVEDTTELRNRTQAESLARHDPLTALPNRVGFLDRLAETIAGANTAVTVLYLDLDRFKNVNDTLGHPAGDKLLRKVADRLRSAIGGQHMIARLGGDEFAVLLVGMTLDAATALTQKLVDLIGRSYLIDDAVVNTGTSIGIARSEAQDTDANLLLQSADLALYAAKEDGRGRFRVFEPAMHARMQARRSIEFDLRKALGMREFELVYQPQFNFERDRIEGCEALLRWRHPTRGVVSPAEFIPIAEEIGAIVPIGEWVLRTACKAAAGWPDHVGVAVNLSAIQVASPRIVPTVISALAASKLAPERLELEITESVLLNDTAATLATLHKLRALNVRISMDDFGTGYSSLSYLRSFPFDKIKIDQSFVRGRTRDKDCVAIVRAIANLGASLGIATTAEGVETEEQRRWVRDEGCTEMQGYLLSKPVPASDIDQLLRTKRAA